MWQMIAGPNLRCSECRHAIQPGRLCLSELPEETPQGVDRKDFRNYCIGCPQCWSQGKHACYVRHLERRSPTEVTPRSLPCARCGRRIGAREKASVDIYYEWPGQSEDSNAQLLPKRQSAELAAATTQAGLIIRGLPNGSFDNLSSTLQRKFMDAGLRPEHGIRTTAEAQSLYQETVPAFVRNFGGDAVRDFLGGKDASHIKSVANAPHLSADPNNIMWESSAINRARGASDMTQWDRFTAQTNNTFDASRIVMRHCMPGAASAAFTAALMEAPVATIENYIHYKRGRKTGEQAIIDAAKSITIHAGTGAVVYIGITIAVGALGAAGVTVAPVIATLAPILLPVGFALYTQSALKRILDALSDGLPLDQVGTYFCSPRCHTKFAYESGLSALMRWDSSRVRQAVP